MLVYCVSVPIPLWCFSYTYHITHILSILSPLCSPLLFPRSHFYFLICVIVLIMLKLRIFTSLIPFSISSFSTKTIFFLVLNLVPNLINPTTLLLFFYPVIMIFVQWSYKAVNIQFLECHWGNYVHSHAQGGLANELYHQPSVEELCIYFTAIQFSVNITKTSNGRCG